MATLTVLDSDGTEVEIEKPNTNGRAAASASRPVALSTEDLAAINALGTALAQLGTQTTLAAILAKIIAAPATEAKQDTLIGHVDGLEALLTAGNSAQATAAKQDTLLAAVQAGTEYETVAASQTNQALGATGAAADLLNGVLIIPATTAPGAVTIKDGAGSAITVFAGGASSVASLVPFFVPLGIRSAAGAWQVTTGANVSAIAVGDFT